MFRRTGKYGKNKEESFKNKIGNFFALSYKLISNNLIRKEVRTMAKDNKEQKEKPEEKEPAIKTQTNSSCGCGCMPIKTK